MYRLFPGMQTALVVALVTVPALAAPPQVTTIIDGNGTTMTITQSETSGDGNRTSRRQVTVTRRSSSGKRPAAPSVDKKRPNFKVGDKVQVEWAGRTHTAEVVGIAGTGWIEVKFERDGMELTPVFPPDKVKRADKTSHAVRTGSATAAAGKLRTWSSKSGKYKVKAKFLEVDDDQVTLEKEDGETVTVAINKLSDADRKLARQLAEAAEGSPFE